VSRYVALLDGGKREVAVEVTDDGPGRYQVRLGDRVHRVDAFRHDYGTLSLIVDTASWSVTFEERANQLRVRVRDQVVPLEVLSERRLRMRRSLSRLTVEGPQPLASPVPVTVLKLLCAAGDEVRQGQPLVLVRALGMENELCSPRDGKVAAVAVQPGQRVAAQERLLTVE
jgi:biotin carboxyl carrier protein